MDTRKIHNELLSNLSYLQMFFIFTRLAINSCVDTGVFCASTGAQIVKENAPKVKEIKHHMQEATKTITDSFYESTSVEQKPDTLLNMVINDEIEDDSGYIVINKVQANESHNNESQEGISSPTSYIRMHSQFKPALSSVISDDKASRKSSWFCCRKRK